jgi:hypothetical protein
MLGQERVGQDGPAVEPDQEAGVAEPGEAVRPALALQASQSVVRRQDMAVRDGGNFGAAEAPHEEAGPVAEVAAAGRAAGRIAEAACGVVPGPCGHSLGALTQAAGKDERQRGEAPVECTPAELSRHWTRSLRRSWHRLDES